MWSLGTAFCAILLALCRAGEAAWSQTVDPTLWGAFGNVTGIARSGNTIYIAGAFTKVGPNTGSGVPLDRTSGAALPVFPKVAGTIRAVIPDGHDGWFIGGWFVGVGGLPRTGLAHVLSDGSVSDWAPVQDGHVEALALKGDTLFVGGAFTSAGGAERSNLAALDAVTGAALAWDIGADRSVRALLVVGSRLFVGGDFFVVGGQDRRCLAAIDLETGAVADWDPVGNPSYAAYVQALAVQGDTLYFGGAFGIMGGTRFNVAAATVGDGRVTEWNPWAAHCNCNRYDGHAYVSELVATPGSIYVAGHFTTIAGVERGGIAEVDPVMGLPTSWDPGVGPRYVDIAPYVTALGLTDSTIYVGGAFHSIGGQERGFIAEVDRRTAVATSWDPSANASPSALSVGARAVYVGGQFTTLGRWVRRINLAAFDARTGEPTAWNPDPDGLIVYEVAVTHGKVYAAGHFSRIGRQERWGLAALDTLGGDALGWTANVDETPGIVRVVGDTLFVGGAFAAINGIPRSRVASFDLTTEALTSWNPGPNDDVIDIAFGAGVAYLGGWFSSVGGRPRNTLAAVDATTGEVLDWDPGSAMDNWVEAVEVLDSTVFVGGAFTNIGGKPRNRIAALDARTGAVKDWVADIANANPYFERIFDLEVAGDVLYAGGLFDMIGGRTRWGLAALDPVTAEVLDWDPALQEPTGDFPISPGIVRSLEASGNTLYVGGRFTSAGSIPVQYFAAITRIPDPAPPPAPLPNSLAISSISPNPTRSVAVVRFALPSAGAVDLDIFDLQGRRVASLLKHRQQAAGFQQVEFSTAGWREGFYFCRLQACGGQAVRKIVVLK